MKVVPVVLLLVNPETSALQVQVNNLPGKTATTLIEALGFLEIAKHVLIDQAKGAAEKAAGVQEAPAGFLDAINGRK